MNKELNRSATNKEEALPIKVLQFGEGNFLRAFADRTIEEMNKSIDFNAGVAVVQPIEAGMSHLLEKQEGLFHHQMQGLKGGQPYSETTLVSCIQKVINPFKNIEKYFDQAINKDLEIVISNTTEAGIKSEQEALPGAGELANTFPGKLTQLLYERYKHFSGSSDSGLVFIPCELIEDNGVKLKQAILTYSNEWKLGSEFNKWIENHNYFSNTLVDRIVPGFPKDKIEGIRNQIGYDDQLVVESEVFQLWVIQGDAEVQKRFPANEAGLNVKFVADISPYRTRKVRILNGAHTCMVPVGLLSEIETVREAVEDKVLGSFIIQAIEKDIIPNISLSKDELDSFATEIIERFKNPFIRHELKSISLNSISKFRVRVLPSLIDSFDRTGQLPRHLVFSFTCLIRLYLSDWFEPNDDTEVLKTFEKIKSGNLATSETIDQILSNEAFWGHDLGKISGLKVLMVEYFDALESMSPLEFIKKEQFL